MKQRIDILLVQAGLAGGRDRAKALIMAGQVYADGVQMTKPGQEVERSAALEVRENPIPWVSRGGLKLQKALEIFPISLTDAACADIGASTGGFTDCMLSHGAARVYAVDVGYGQLAWKLREDPRVISLERTNARYLTAAQIPQSLDFIGADVSFISLSLLFPVFHTLLAQKGQAVCLVKPQFEAGREKVGKNGVVRDPAVHLEVLERICKQATGQGFSLRGLSFSPVRGPRGNIEYLLYLSNDEDAENFGEELIKSIVRSAHEELNQ